MLQQQKKESYDMTLWPTLAEVAALNYKILDHTMKGTSFIVKFFGRGGTDPFFAFQNNNKNLFIKK